ncbi:hypothetical protein MMC29_002632 [Sticta canariensis]|nr:hypothetical protein [Sticta canariensis]
MEVYKQGGSFQARLYEYITKDDAWVHIEQEAFERDWASTKEVASLSNTTQQRCTAARQTILEQWGEEACELVDGQTWNRTQKISALCNAYPSLQTALPRLNRARIARRYRMLAINREWKFKSQTDDYERALHLEGIPEFTELDLNQADVDVDEAGMLRQQPLGGGGYVEGTLPPGTPGPQIRELPVRSPPAGSSRRQLPSPASTMRLLEDVPMGDADASEEGDEGEGSVVAPTGAIEAEPEPQSSSEDC